MKFNNETIRQAVSEWLYDAVSVEAKYGKMVSWSLKKNLIKYRNLILLN